jgi:hypothetical protein
MAFADLNLLMLTKVKVYEVLGFVCDIRTEVAANNTMPPAVEGHKAHKTTGSLEVRQRRVGDSISCHCRDAYVVMILQ